MPATSYLGADSFTFKVNNGYNDSAPATVSFSVQASQGCASTPAGLVSKWAAEGSAADAAGGNAGTLINSPSFGAGEVGQAFHFDGASQYVKLANSASLTRGQLFD